LRRIWLPVLANVWHHNSGLKVDHSQGVSMASLILYAILLLALPFAVFVGGAWTIGQFVGREYVINQLGQKVKAEDQTPLNQRFTGYDLEEVDRHWSALDDRGRTIEQHFLKLDLVFPFLYGGALAGALLLLWAALERPFHFAWLVSPVVITAFADWIENMVQLSQLQLYIEKGKSGLAVGWIQIASAATVVKLMFFLGASLLLVCLDTWMVIRELHSPL
jgi:hypothetical protein